MDKKEVEKQVGTRIAHLPKLAADLFSGDKKDGERVRTLMMKVDLSSEALAAFGPLAASADETKERLDYVTDQWTGAIQQMLNRLKGDLFERRRDILLSVAAERDFDAAIAADKGWLEATAETYELGTVENALAAPICRHYKIGKEMVAPGNENAKAHLCAKIGDGLYLKLEMKKAEQDKGGNKDAGSREETLSIKSFDAQNFGGFLSAAYWSEKMAKSVGAYKFGSLGESYARANHDRTRAVWLKDGEFCAGVGEAVRQKVAENVCGFLEKYYSVQPEVARFNVYVQNSIVRTQKFLEEKKPELTEEATARLGEWQEIADGFRVCDGHDPKDVERLRNWVSEYNMRTNELRQVLPTGWFEEFGSGYKKLDKLKDLKGYPSWPDYKADDGKSFQDALSALQTMIGKMDLSPEAVQAWVVRAYTAGEVRRLNYLAGRHAKKRKKTGELPMRVKIAHEIFARTGGRIVQPEDVSLKRSVSWSPDDRKIKTVVKSIVARLNRDFDSATSHVAGEITRKDFFARRRQVDILVTLANLCAETVLAEGRAKYLAEVNRLAGDAKGALLALAEGTKEEIQITGFSVKPGKSGRTWSLQKNAGLVVAGRPDEHARLALLFDPSGEKDDPVNIETGISGALQAVGYSGGADKRDSTDEQKARNLVVGTPTGNLGQYGLVLPLQFGSSQARRYFYPGSGHREDGIVGAMTAGRVDIGSARIVRKTGLDGKVEYFVAMSVKLPRPQLNSRDVAPQGYIGVDRGETHLAVMAETDLRGRLVGEPQPFGHAMMNRVGRSYERMRRNQSQMKRLKGGDWFEARINNAVRLIAIKAVEMMLTQKRAVVFEDLSRGFARGGTASWEHQYTKVEDQLKDVLAFCGLKAKEIYHYTDANKDKGYNWFGKVGRAYTSQTCPSCGTVWGKPEIDRHDGVVKVKWDNQHAPRPGVNEIDLKQSGQGWSLVWSDDTTISVPAAVAKKCAEYASASNKSSDEAKKAEKTILGWLSHRSRLDYEHFRCRYCGVTLHADKVGALNIARKAVFQMTNKRENRKRNDWQKWYLDRLTDPKAVWWNAETEKWLR